MFARARGLVWRTEVVTSGQQERSPPLDAAAVLQCLHCLSGRNAPGKILVEHRLDISMASSTRSTNFPVLLGQRWEKS